MNTWSVKWDLIGSNSMDLFRVSVSQGYLTVCDISGESSKKTISVHHEATRQNNSLSNYPDDTMDKCLCER